MESKPSRLSPFILILPVYNEQESLPPLLAVIVIDDGSQDSTAQVVRDFNQNWVKLIQHPRNMGLAQAMRTGLAANIHYWLD